jgi:endonuclease/exonuclease/phosphatase family metal-dependent hydrolase
MKRIFLLPVLFLLLCGPLSGREFTVLVYNVENLFDVDRVALYQQYGQGAAGDYGPGPLLNKLERIRRTLAAVNEGAGPEVILFQEFELDRTPYGTPDPDELLRRTRGRPLAELLAEDAWARNLPAELLLLKYLDDHGLGGYHVAKPDPARMESHPPHHNVVFSRFPVSFTRQRPKLDARDLLVVGLDVDGRELIVLNNHWKSGASNAGTEPVRVQNARVVRAELEAILTDNPRADVIIAGDFNAYYNHKAVFPDLPETAVNDVLRANGFESRMVEEGSRNLYNLWFELPPEERGSEVWQGRWGTLMQMVLTPGLYDQRGIQYVDNSFGRLILPGENVETRWGRPIAWTNHGGGAGFSDHLPVYARFRVVAEERDGWMELHNPTDEALSDFRPRVRFERMDRRAVPPLERLGEMPPAERARSIGRLFVVDTVLAAANPPTVRAGELELQVFSPVRALRDVLSGLEPGDRLQAFADLDDWRGRLQVVIRDPSWLKEPAAPSQDD